MSRPLRVEFPGALYHVTSRGDRREAIYLDDADRQQWLALFGQVCQRFNWICHAYCLMDKHFHIARASLGSGLALQHVPLSHQPMSRPLRVEFHGALHHVTSRGDRREGIYLDDADRQQWLTFPAQSGRGVCKGVAK